MADDSELDYIRTFLAYASYDSTVKHYSEARKIDMIDNTRRILIYPGELLNVNGSFYTKRYRVQLSESSEANLMDTFNNLVNELQNLSRGQETLAYYTETSFDTSGEISQEKGICWDGTFFWIVDSGNRRVYKYTAAGAYASVNFDISGEISAAAADGICWDGTYFWVLSTVENSIFKYNASGTYQSSYIDTSGESAGARGVTWDGTYFWVTETTNERINRYTAAGAYDNHYIDASSEGNAIEGICWDGTYFWTIEDNSNYAYKYTAGGTYTGVSIYVYTQTGTDINGIEYADGYLYVPSRTNSAVYKYNRTFYTRPSVLVYITLKYGNKAYEVGSTKRWYQDIYLDIEWCTS
ncbi:hypothetical protein LCGC14_2314590 [marine sediment metagenome]|uniref:Uncharacterized protein n=1 Tax=marine sediment metagenome TaxID=412755 RepID=A0A0F9FEG9_9ZZZZ